MNKDQLFAKFSEMFPDWALAVVSYKKIGSKTLSIKFATPFAEVSRVFLYAGPDNWQFGTKLWRKRPEKVQKKDVAEEVQND